MAAPCGMRTRYNRPLRRLTRPDVMRAHDSFRPSPGRSPRTSPDSFSRVGPPFCVVPSAEPTCDGLRAELFNFYEQREKGMRLRLTLTLWMTVVMAANLTPRAFGQAASSFAQLHGTVLDTSGHAVSR